MTGRGSSSARATLPPIGQGLAVIVSIFVIALLTMLGVAGYLVSLHIAAKKADSDRVEARIVATRQQVAALGTELEIRSRYRQLGLWGDQLGLAPVAAGQTVNDPRQLAAVADANNRSLAAQNIDAPGYKGYPVAARQSLDQLVADALR